MGESLVKRLAAHLEGAYGIEVERMTPLEPWAPEGAQRVDRRDGAPWVVRVLPPERPIEEVHGDAALLRFLEDHDFPAERCAHPEAVTSFADRSVLVTELLPGTNCRGRSDPEFLTQVGDLLGRLHTLPHPGAGSPVARPAGGWHHCSKAGGGRQADVDALLPAIDARAATLHHAQLGDLHAMRDCLEAIDRGDGLPEALINIDFGGPNLMRDEATGSLAAVDWVGAGWGPRVLSMGTLMHGDDDPSLVDAFLAGYHRHTRLTEDELDRLAAALSVFMFVLDVWCFAHRGDPTPKQVLANLASTRAGAERVADRARQVTLDLDLAAGSTSP